MADITPETMRVERVATGETWDYQKGKPRTTYIYVCKLGEAELYRDTNPAFAGAFRKGYAAAQKGKPKRANPYNALSTCRGGPTFALALYRFWNRGYDACKKAE